MGTRGIYGFRKNGIDKITYNHYDSYPDCLGRTMIDFVRKTSVKTLNKIYDDLILVSGSHTPRAEQIEECKQWADTGVSTGSLTEWYCLLRKVQGNPDAYLHGVRYMIDDHKFIKDSLFCEYGYIINLDENKLEFFVGFQRIKDEENRYGYQDDNGYYPCKMLLSWSFDEIMASDPDEIVNIMQADANLAYNTQEMLLGEEP